MPRASYPTAARMQGKSYSPKKFRLNKHSIQLELKPQQALLDMRQSQPEMHIHTKMRLGLGVQA